ncbi:MAG: nucleotidyltransferase family protein [Candidatus Nitrosocaldaceae archaeon]
MKGVILAGGLGTRMQPYTFFLPKPMLPLADKPLLEYIISWLKENGIEEIVICISYLGKTIEDYFKDGNSFGVKIEYARSDRPLGTSGQLKSAEKHLNDRFICVYGDSIYEFSLSNIIEEHIKKRAFITMTLMRYTTRLEYGFIDVNGDGRVKAWHEKPEYQGLINIGCYIMEPEIFNYIESNKAIGMDELFRSLLKEKSIYSYIIDKGFIDIGNKKTYKEAYRQYLARLGKI